MKHKSQCARVVIIFWILFIFFTISTAFSQGTGQAPMRGGDFIGRFDQDNDGKVSQEEFLGPDAHFYHLDQDQDGYIDEDEKPSGKRRGPGGESGGSGGPGGTNPMDRMDKDGDGKISMEEFPGPDQHFNQFDADGDGFLDESELPKGPPPRRNSGAGFDGSRENLSESELNKLDSTRESTTTSSGLYTIVDTGVTKCFDNFNEIDMPGAGEAFYGQDAQHQGNSPFYADNGDGTVTDHHTGLMWQQDPGDKKSWNEALEELETFELAGYEDWRLPTIKELYSLILFSGKDPNIESTDTDGLTPFIDTDFFEFTYGDTEAGERIIDSQYMSATRYVSTTMNGDPTVFGVNFADGRIKGYGMIMRGFEKKFYVLYVRENTAYGQNNFVDNNDDTITDLATGLMWTTNDSSYFNAGMSQDGSMNWEEALLWAQNLEHAGYSDWRLPNAKELQSIVDYARSPSTTDSAAIDPVFNVTAIKDEGGNINYPFYWTGTTHESQRGGQAAVYVAFGEALGFMESSSGDYTLLDVHGAGAQRSDPKAGDLSDFPIGRGPQGDVVRIYNFARCVRNVSP
ncbi:MAG: DUF1566 domain-containing protein [Desulfobacteraceae bacterium]|nr:DUF1566 domain-containing protein [Desulfobacteraceae bacterium]